MQSKKLTQILCTLAATGLIVGPARAEPTKRHLVQSLEIVILSTMLAERGIGEWGFSALVEADGHRILVDTGAHSDTVIRNAETLGVDLSSVEQVVLTHSHGDHTGGLLALRREYASKSPKALSVVHAGRGILWDRPESRWPTTMAERKAAYEQLGGSITEHDGPTELHPGIWITGPVPRRHPERSFGNPFDPTAPITSVRSPGGLVEDNVPESVSLVIETPKGLVVISGCGHAGMVNTLEYARELTGGSHVHAAIGGFHLLASTEDQLAWTASKLVGLGLEKLIGAHCTGLEAVYRLRELAKLDRASAVVGAVGASFTLADGIDPLMLAR